jgi:hypothetical protein
MTDKPEQGSAATASVSTPAPTRSIRDYVQFHCLAATLGTELAAKRMFEEFKRLDDFDESLSGHMDLLATMYTCTERVTFTLDGSERNQVREFQKAWEKHGGKTAALWQLRKNMPDLLVSAWITAFNEAQTLFDVPIEQKPFSWLTADEQAEALDINSPLAVSAANGNSA